jgi:hypothetical protein
MAADAPSLESCYAILELPFGDGLAEVRRAYRRLVAAWHPDRFAGDASRQYAAQLRMAQFNAAYGTLTAYLRDNPPPRPAPQAVRDAAPLIASRIAAMHDRAGNREWAAAGPVRREPKLSRSDVLGLIALAIIYVIIAVIVIARNARG